VNVADITTGSIASDQPITSAVSDQRSDITRLIAPVPRPLRTNKTKNALAIRPICSSLKPISSLRSWATRPRTVLPPQFTT